MRIFAHRGASRAAGDNTLEAFRLAVELGADGIELDVRRASDGRLLVCHDPLPSGPDQMKLPTLVEALDACSGIGVVNIEIKNSRDDPDYDPSMRVVEATVDEIRRRVWVIDADGEPERGCATGEPERTGEEPTDEERFARWLVSSFSWETVDYCRKIAPEVPTAWLTTAAVAHDIEETAAAGHRAIHPEHRLVDAGLIAAAHAAGLEVNVWTCNDSDELRALRDLGVDGVCTDVPDTARDALAR